MRTIMFSLINILSGLFFIYFFSKTLVEMHQFGENVGQAFSFMTHVCYQKENISTTFKTDWMFYTGGYTIGICYIGSGLSIITQKVIPKMVSFIVLFGCLILIGLSFSKIRISDVGLIEWMIVIATIMLLSFDAFYLSRTKTTS